jgi:hypothetical protein
MLYMIKIYIFLIKYNKNIKIILTFICSIKFFNKKISNFEIFLVILIYNLFDLNIKSKILNLKDNY